MATGCKRVISLRAGFEPTPPKRFDAEDVPIMRRRTGRFKSNALTTRPPQHNNDKRYSKSITYILELLFSLVKVNSVT